MIGLRDFWGNVHRFILLCTPPASLQDSSKELEEHLILDVNVFFTVPVVAKGGKRYSDGTAYVGDWDTEGRRQGEGHILFPDGTRYDGWFHGYGIFWRADGTRHEGEFRGGKIWGLGLTTFGDNTNGFPRNEGFFQDCQLKKLMKCPEAEKELGNLRCLGEKA
nr:unnamed protein product [Callosobruchus analis]